MFALLAAAVELAATTGPAKSIVVARSAELLAAACDHRTCNCTEVLPAAPGLPLYAVGNAQPPPTAPLPPGVQVVADAPLRDTQRYPKGPPAEMLHAVAGRHPNPRTLPPHGAPQKFHFDGDGARVYVLGAAVNCTAIGGACRTVHLDQNGTAAAGRQQRGTQLAAAVRAVATQARIVSVPMPGTMVELLRALLVAMLDHAAAGGGCAVLLVAAGTVPDDDPQVGAPHLDEIMLALRDVGIVPVVAAGNYHTDACRTAPANAPSALTVSSLSADGTSAAPNTGPCCNVYGVGAGSSDTGLSAAVAAGVVAGLCGDDATAGAAWVVADSVVTNSTLRRGPDGLMHPTLHTPPVDDAEPIIPANSPWGVLLLAGAILAAASLA